VSAPSAVGAPRTTAPFGRRDVPVVGVAELGAYRLLSVVDGSGVVPRAGQFYMLATARSWAGGEDGRPFLGRACSVARAVRQDGRMRLDFFLEAVGPGTARLCAAEVGEDLSIVGPLGTGFAAPPPGARALLVGGGVGIAPLAIWQDEILAAGGGATVLLGFRDSAHAAGAELLHDAAVATDDGSAGRHGLVTELLAAELGEPGAVVYACGPPPMLEAVRELCEERGVEAQLALESGMACGFGACYGCVVPTRDGGYLRVCVDGPVVDARRLATALAPGHS
jgi:NAD(P)H-flavin reductase